MLRGGHSVSSERVYQGHSDGTAGSTNSRFHGIRTSQPFQHEPIMNPAITHEQLVNPAMAHEQLISPTENYHHNHPNSTNSRMYHNNPHASSSHRQLPYSHTTPQLPTSNVSNHHYAAPKRQVESENNLLMYSSGGTAFPEDK